MGLRYQTAQVTVTLAVPITASTTTYGAPFQLAFPCDWAVIIATLVAGSASTLDVAIQETWDGGTTWTDVCHFTQVTAAATVQYRVVTSHLGLIQAVKSGTVASAVPALTAGKVCDGPWAPLLRLVATTGTGTNSGIVTQTILLIANQASE